MLLEIKITFRIIIAILSGEIASGIFFKIVRLHLLKRLRRTRIIEVRARQRNISSAVFPHARTLIPAYD